MEAPELVALLTGRRIAVLTGAGMSTDSGIPDYRGPDSPPSNPMTIRQFTSDPVFRQRYWARNHVGWRHMDDTLPNAGHRALAALEHAGVLTGLITQNVDLLHTKAGSQNVVNLHGTYAQVVCLSCGFTMSRAELADELEALNPGFTEQAERVGGIAVAPDADATVSDTDGFRYLDCPRCAGMLKPDIVYFGENVPKDRVAQAYSLVDEAEALLVAGSSLTVFSGYRFVRHAAATGVPVAIINRGPTRGDEQATVKLDNGCSEMLVLLADELSPLGFGVIEASRTALPANNLAPRTPPEHHEAMGEVIHIPTRAGQPGHSSDPDPLWRDVLGRRLRMTREAQGHRLVDVAERAGISPQYLSEIERGRKEPSSEMIAAVSGALGINLIRLLGGISADLSRATERRPAGPLLLAA